MNLEELAYANQQLAAMLRDGLPLGGALKELVGGLNSGRLSDELKSLEADIASGRPLEEAVARRKFPPLYARLLIAGARSGDLPGALTMAADHFGEIHQRRLRLRTLMVYPGLVILVGLVLTLLIGWLEQAMMGSLYGNSNRHTFGRLGVWILPGAFALLGVLGVALSVVKPLRRWLAWRLPGFRENRVASLSGSVGLMLRQHCPLPDALALARELEEDPRVQAELNAWLSRIAHGEPPLRGAAGGTVLPSLLPWLVGGSASDLGDGFLRAATFYHRRAMHRLDLLVNGALPVALVLLGAVTGVQLFFILRLLATTLDSLGME